MRNPGNRRSLPTRRKRLRRELLLLLALLCACYVLLDFPCFTAGQAYRALETRHFYGPGQILRTAQLPGTFSHRYYISRSGGLLAWGGVDRAGPFWQPSQLEMGMCPEDADFPLVPLLLDEDFGHALAVVSHDPAIVRVTAQFPVLGDSGWFLAEIESTDMENQCFLLQYRADSSKAVCFTAHMTSDRPDLVLFSGYDSAGSLLYRSPAPDWSFYGLSD